MSCNLVQFGIKCKNKASLKVPFVSWFLDGGQLDLQSQCISSWRVGFQTRKSPFLTNSTFNSQCLTINIHIVCVWCQLYCFQQYKRSGENYRHLKEKKHPFVILNQASLSKNSLKMSLLPCQFVCVHSSVCMSLYVTSCLHRCAHVLPWQHELSCFMFSYKCRTFEMICWLTTTLSGLIHTPKCA